MSFLRDYKQLILVIPQTAPSSTLQIYPYLETHFIKTFFGNFLIMGAWLFASWVE